ncbi:MAG: AraC family ligand binding domain-containing protein [Bryobacteraceae bacterium]
MPRLIPDPTQIPVPGGKRIDEYIGHVNSQTSSLSVAHMRSPAGWTEPGQRPSFQEVTLVLRGLLRVEHADGVLQVRAGQAIIAEPGEWVRYSTPTEEGAEYVAICLPAFTLDTANRDPE